MEHSCYAFMINVDPFPNLYLVEISSRTNLEYRQVSFYEPNVRYCTPVMDIVLKEIQDNGSFFGKYWSALQEILFHTLCNNENHTMEELHNIVVNTIISTELIILSDQLGIMDTPMNTDRLEFIGVETKMLRIQRIENETNHTSSLLLDCELSLQELQFTIASNLL